MKTKSLSLFNIMLVVTLIVPWGNLGSNNWDKVNSPSTETLQELALEDQSQSDNPPPSPGETTEEAEEGRARKAMEDVLSKHLDYWGPRYSLDIDKGQIQDDWAYATASWVSQAKFSEEPLYILAHRSEGGNWQALLPGSDGQYTQWVEEVPIELLDAAIKNQMLNQDSSMDYFTNPTDTRSLITEAESDISLVPGTVEVELAVEEGVINTLINNSSYLPELENYAITDVEKIHEKLFVSVIGLQGLDESLEWNLIDNGSWFGLIILKKGKGGLYSGALEGTEDFSILIEEIPDDVLSDQTKKSLDPLQESSVLVDGYIFPWQSGTSMMYGSNGVHDNGFSGVVPGWKAVDFLSDGNTGAGHAPNKLLASASGSISYKCNPGAGQVTTAIRIGDLMYTHLLNSSNLYVGRSFSQGEEMGQMKSGSFSENCGYASQGSSWFHVHWGFPNTGSFQADGWTLTFSDQLWRKGSEVHGTGWWFQAGGTPPCPQSGGVILYKHANYDCGGEGDGSGFVQRSSTGWQNVPSGINDLASSLKVPSGWSVKLFEHADRGGASVCRSGDDSDFSGDYFDGSLVGLNDKISSFEVFNNTTCGGPTPNPPTLDSPADGWTFNEGNSITLSWSATGNDYYGEVWGGPAGTTPFGWQTSTSKNIGSQWAGYVYSWHVKARNGVGESGWSSTRSFTVKPGQPSNLSAQAPTCNQVNLSWNDNSGNEDGYKIYRNGAYVNQLGANITSYQDNGLAENTNYSYYVKAYRGSIESDASDPVSITTPDCPSQPPTPPTLVSPPNGEVFDEGDAIDLIWSATGDEYYGEVWGGPAGITPFGWQTNTSKNIGSQWAGYVYSWHIKAKNSDGESPWSSTGSFTVKPGDPTNLTAESPSCSQVNLSWTDNSGNEEGFKIYRNGIYINQVGANITTYQDNGLSENTTYSYNVTSFRGSIESWGFETAYSTTPLCQALMPDLQPYAPDGFPYPVVPSSISGTHEVDTLIAGQETYFDWNFINSGNAIAVGGFFVELRLDGVWFVRYPYSDFGAGWTGGFDDWMEPVATPGWHTITLVTDPDNTIAESDETNNIWEAQFYWTTSAPYFDDMESGANGWTATGLWHQVDDTSPYPGSKSPTHSWWYGQDTTGTYDTGAANFGELNSPSIYVPTSGYYLRFWYWYETETYSPDYDLRWVEISVNGGPFNGVLQLHDDPMQEWLQYQALDLTAYAGQTIQIRFRFHTLDELFNNYRGWYIDDFEISTVQPPTCFDSNEPNNVYTQAKDIAFGQSLYGDICPKGDYDFFKFSGISGDRVVLDVDAVIDGSWLDSYIYLLDSDGETVLEENDDAEGSLDSKLGYQLPHDGTYFIKARAYSHPNVGGYDHFYTLNLFTDNANPANAQITSPLFGSWLNPNLQTVTASATDNESGINRVEFLWHDSDWNNPDWVWLGADSNGSDGWSWDFDTSTQPDQQGVDFYIWAFDWVGNWTGAGVGGLGIDRTPPTSNVLPLPAESPADFTVSWSGTDNLSSSLTYDIQFSDDGGAWVDWQSGVTTTSASFVGTADHTYAFRSRAHDPAGNVELWPDTADAQTIIQESDGLIFKDGFESGDFSAWTSCVTDGGDLSVTQEAALVGNYGMQALIDSNGAIYCTDDNPNAEPRYRARFYFDPNSIGMASGNSHFILYGISGTTTVVTRLELRYYNGSYQLRGALLDDATTWKYSPYFPISDAERFVEIDWRAATGVGANDGGLTLWIDGVQKANLGGVDNDTRRIDRARLGPVGGIDTATRGTTYFDEFESRRDDYIGPAEILADFSASPTGGSPPLEVTFTNLSQPESLITGYLWDFGDNQTSTEANPVHTYTTLGSKTVTLTVYGDGVEQTVTKPDYINLSDTIFGDDFESCDLSKWSSSTIDGGDLSATAAAALVGTCGMQALMDDNVSIYVTDDSPGGEPRYRARFYFDPNSIGMASGNSFFLFYGYSGTTTVVTRLEFRYYNGNYQLRAALLNDATTWKYSLYYTITDAPHFIEIDWRAATGVGANDGGLTLWIDGMQKSNLIGVDNDTRRIDRIRLGAVGGIDTATRGTTYFDEFESTRQSYIGP